MSFEMVESLKYGIYFLKKMSNTQQKQINIGLTDLVTFNFIHFLYTILYSVEDSKSPPIKDLGKLNKNFKHSFYFKSRMFLLKYFVMLKINIRWLMFIISH